MQLSQQTFFRETNKQLPRQNCVSCLIGFTHQSTLERNVSLVGQEGNTRQDHKHEEANKEYHTSVS